jgi:hypothetical protein
MFTFRQVHRLPTKNKMASTEVMRAGVRVAVAFILSEMSTLLERKEKKKKYVWVREWISKRNQLGASGTLMKELALGDIKIT